MTRHQASLAGEAIRDAAEDLADRFPDLPGAVIGRLNLLARRHDVAAVRDAEHAAEEQRARLRAADSRGRWVRRAHGNGGPGTHGIGHIAVTARRTPHDDTAGLCGTKLRGELHWGHVADSAAPQPLDWRPCMTCWRLLAIEVGRSGGSYSRPQVIAPAAASPDLAASA